MLSAPPLRPRVRLITSSVLLLACSSVTRSSVTQTTPPVSATTAAPAASPALDLAAIRAQYRAFDRLRAVLGWYTRTQGEPPLSALLYLGREPLFSAASLAVIDSALRRPDLAAEEALGLRFLRLALASERVSLQLAPFDDEVNAASIAAKVRVAFDSQPMAFLHAPLRLATERDAGRRAQLYEAISRVTLETLNPILVRKEAAAQAAARTAGYADYVAMSEELRGTRIDSVLAEGIEYVKATDSIYRVTADRVAREEVGVGLDRLRVSDWSRLFASPSVIEAFRKEMQLPALTMFLSGIGLDMKTLTGGEVKIDDSLHPLKVRRAAVFWVDPPADVRLVVKPQDGMQDMGTLFHEAGHAVHMARVTITPWEAAMLGQSNAPTEAFGEFFRTTFEDPRFLARFKAFLVARGQPALSNAQLAAVMRRSTLQQMNYIRRYAFAKLLYELRLHGRSASQDGTAMALLPAPDRVRGDDDASLRELYGQALSVAYGFTLNEAESARYRSDVDDTFYSADYSRAFALAAMMHDAIRRKFGVDWYGNPEVGKFLTEQLFARGTSLSAEDVAERLGFPRRMDFALAARRARAVLAAADSLERSR